MFQEFQPEVKLAWNGGPLIRLGSSELDFTPLFMIREIEKRSWFERGVPVPVHEGDDLDSVGPTLI